MGTRVPKINVLSKNKKNITFFRPKNYHFYSREKSLYITWACFRTVFVLSKPVSESTAYLKFTKSGYFFYLFGRMSLKGHWWRLNRRNHVVWPINFKRSQCYFQLISYYKKIIQYLIKKCNRNMDSKDTKHDLKIGLFSSESSFRI